LPAARYRACASRPLFTASAFRPRASRTAAHVEILTCGADMELKTVRIQIPEGANIILGQTHFIKTAEDLYEILAGASPHIKFGVAFTEASGPCLIRYEGNDTDLTQSAVGIVENIGAGHVFAILIREAFPINI